MPKRHKMSRRSSGKYFSRAAGRVHKKNMLSSSAASYTMRGGTRL